MQFVIIVTEACCLSGDSMSPNEGQKNKKTVIRYKISPGVKNIHFIRILFVFSGEMRNNKSLHSCWWNT